MQSLLKPGRSQWKIRAEIEPIDGCGEKDDFNSISGNVFRRAAQSIVTLQHGRGTGTQVAIRTADQVSWETWQQK